MEAPEKPLKTFSPLLLLEYIRIMTAAAYVAEEKPVAAKFSISPENYAEMMKESLQTALIGIDLEYDAENAVLSAVPNEAFLERYNNKIMREVALMFAQNYGKRYEDFIRAL